MKSKSRAASLAQCKRALAGLPYMEELSSFDIAALKPLARVHDFCAGSVLFYEDDEPDAVYFLERGAVEIFKSDDLGKKMPLAILREHGVVGEMGLLVSEPRSASVRTLGAVRAVVFESSDITAALESGSLAAYRLVLGIARVLSQRLAQADQALFELCMDKNSPATIANYTTYKQSFLKSC